MQKRGRDFIKGLAFSQAFIIVLSVFSSAFLVGEIGFVNAQTTVPEPTAGTGTSRVSRFQTYIVK